MISERRIKEIRKETDEMFEKDWASMNFNEQQKALEKDRKHKYIHCILKINDSYTKDFEKHKEFFNEFEEHYMTVGERLHKINEELRQKNTELKKEIADRDKIILTILSKFSKGE